MKSTVVVLRDMVSVEDLDEELESEVTEECSRHGKVSFSLLDDSLPVSIATVALLLLLRRRLLLPLLLLL